MSSFLPLVGAWAAGMALGLFYFGGLWLTVRQIPHSRWPAFLLVASFVGRTALTLIGFYYVMDGRWQQILACLVGFTMMRLMVVIRLRPDRMPDALPGKEGL